MTTTKPIYRIRVIFIGKGIERTLPYELDEEQAEQVTTTLNSLLEDKGYHQYVVPTEPVKQFDHSKRGWKRVKA